MREKISELVMKLDSSLSIHDFRMVTGDSRTSVIFDVVAPQEFVMTDEELRKEIEGRIQKQYPNHYAVIKVEKAYV